MPTLIEILDSNELVFLDSSSKASGSFLWEIYDCKNFESFDLIEISNEEEKFQKFLNLLRHPNAATIPELTKETEEYYKILGEKLAFFSKRDRDKKLRNFRKRHHKKLREDDGNIIDDENTAETLLRELYQTAFLTYQLSKRKEISINEPKYDSLVEIVKLLSKEMELKRDTYYLYGKGHKDPYSSDTDERLVSTLYWHCLFSDKSPTLVARDRDFIRLLKFVSRSLGAEEFLPYNQNFRDALTKNPFKLYMVDDEEKDDLVLNSQEIEYVSKLKIFHLPIEREKEVKQQVLDFWKQFSYLD